jgi:hypothetical protein
LTEVGIVRHWRQTDDHYADKPRTAQPRHESGAFVQGDGAKAPIAAPPPSSYGERETFVRGRAARPVRSRRVYGAGETPDDVAAQFTDALDRLATGEGYDDEP